MEATVNNTLSDRIEAIMQLIETKYHNDFSHYCDAEKEIDNSIRIYNNLIGLSTNINNNQGLFSTKNEKTTYVDLKNKTVWLENANDCDVNAVISYSYDYMTTRRVFPYSLNLLFDRSYNKDKYKLKNEDEKTQALKILNWVKERTLNTQFQLISMNLDKNTGILNYNTSTRDSTFGNTLQYITAVIDKKRKVNIPNLGITDTPFNIAKNFSSAFTYFIMFGFTEFYARCNCNDYYQKYTKRKGIQNYFCSHIMYSLAQFPWYASLFLEN